MKNTLSPLTPPHTVHPSWFRWLDRLLCVAVAFTIFHITMGGLLHGGMALSAHSEPTTTTQDAPETTSETATEANNNSVHIAAYTAQTTRYTPAPKTAPTTAPAITATAAHTPAPTTKAKVAPPAAKPVAVQPKTTPPVVATAKKRLITPPVTSVTHALSKPVPKEAPKKPEPAPQPTTAPLPITIGAAEDTPLEIIANPQKNLSNAANNTLNNANSHPDLAVTIPNQRVEKAITAHVKAIAQQQGYYTPGTDTLLVSFPYINPTPLTFFQANLNPNDVSIDVESNLAEFFSHQSMAKLKLTPPNGESKTVAIPFKVTLTRPVWVVGSTPIAPGQTLQTAQFKVEKRELTHDITSVMNAQQPLKGKAAKLVLKPGTVLHQYQIMTPMMVKSYSQVHMVMSAPNGVHMLLEGKALEDGRIGDRIRIQNKINPSKIYTGVVIGDNRVSVKL